MKKLLWVIIAFSAYNANSQSIKSNVKLNITMFLDLSDRISPKTFPSPPMEIWKRDVANVNTIVDEFANHLMNKRLIAINEIIKVVCNPIPKVNFDINSILALCNIHFDKLNTDLKKIQNLKSIYQNNIQVLYNKTIQLNDPILAHGGNPYTGSDIYGYFKNRVHTDCIEPNHRNILFILTDGYMYSKDNCVTQGKKTSFITPDYINKNFNEQNYATKINQQAYGFIVPTKGLDSLEVYIIGVAPQRAWHQDVINAYWSKWLKEMGVKNYKNGQCQTCILDNSLPSMQKQIIESIINR